MNHEKKPSDIEQLKQLLAKSFDGSEGDDIPPLPEGLRDRIADQYGHRATPSQNARTSTETLFSRISHLFRTPAFAGVAAVLILLLVATVIIKQPDGTKITRGGGEHTTLTLVLHQLDPATVRTVETADLEAGALRETNNPAELATALDTQGLRIVLDGTRGKILGFQPGQSEPSIEDDLPSDPATLAERIGALQLKLAE